jgi:hypothetical protein
MLHTTAQFWPFLQLWRFSWILFVISNRTSSMENQLLPRPVASVGTQFILDNAIWSLVWRIPQLQRPKIFNRIARISDGNRVCEWLYTDIWHFQIFVLRLNVHEGNVCTYNVWKNIGCEFATPKQRKGFTFTITTVEMSGQVGLFFQ